MKFLLLLTNTKETFDYLFENDKGNYRFHTDLIFLLSGLAAGIIVFFDTDWSPGGIFAKIFPLILLVIVRFLIYKFVFSYLLFWISQNLGGEANLEQIRFILAYSLIPTILIVPVTIIQGIVYLNQIYNQPLSLFLFLIELLSIFYVFKIMTIGLEKLNNYGYQKALMNISPIALLGLLLILLR